MCFSPVELHPIFLLDLFHIPPSYYKWLQIESDWRLLVSGAFYTDEIQPYLFDVTGLHGDHFR